MAEPEPARLTRLKTVLKHAVDSACALLPKEEALAVCASLVEQAPQTHSEISDYQPQLIDQIRDGIQEEFEDLCKEYKLSDKFALLDELLASSDPLPASPAINASAKPEEEARAVAHAVKQREKDALDELLANLRRENDASLAAVAAEEEACRNALKRLETLSEAAAMASSSVAD